MNVDELPQMLRDVTTVKRVYGDPYQVNGLTIIPVARTVGGGGGGEGGTGEDGGSGFGLRFGTNAVGVFVIKGDDVRFVPSYDVVALAGRAAIVLVAGTLAWRSVGTARQRRKGRTGRQKREPLINFGPYRSPSRHG